MAFVSPLALPSAPAALRVSASTSPSRRLSPCFPALPRRPHRPIRSGRSTGPDMSADASSSSQSPEEESVSLAELNARMKDLSPKEGDPEKEEEEEEEEDLRSEKEKEIERLRAAEKFIEVDEGKFECLACSYVYDPAAGEPRNSIPANTPFENLAASYVCPSCRSPKSRFVSRKKIIAGFAENQRYGFGSNGLTGGEKNLLIFGGLVLCALILLSGYALN